MRPIIQHPGLPAWLAVFGLRVALVFASGSRAAVFTITSTTSDGGNQRLTVQGTGTTRRHASVYNADNDESLGLTRNGSHGMHPVAPVSMNNGRIDPGVAFTSWSQTHKQVNDSGCRGCHGNNGQGTVLSRTAADRTLPCKEDNKCDARLNGENVIFVPAGTEVSCSLCHDNKIL